MKSVAALFAAVVVAATLSIAHGAPAQALDESPGIVLCPAVLTGTATVGQTLSVGSVPDGRCLTSQSFCWYRNGSFTAGPAGLPDSRRYTLHGADVGSAISVVVVGNSACPATTSQGGVATSEVVSTAPFPMTALHISGKPRLNAPLTAKLAHSIEWEPGQVLDYRWYSNGRLYAQSHDWSASLHAAQMGTTITATLTISAPGYITASETAPAIFVPKPAMKRGAAAIRGVSRVGRTLRVHVHGWADNAKLTYRWYANGTAIVSATHVTYRVKQSASGKRLTVAVTAQHPGYTATTATSAATSRVRAR